MTDSRNEKFVLNAQGVSNCLFFDEDGDLLLSKSLNMYILLLLLWYISKVGVLTSASKSKYIYISTDSVSTLEAKFFEKGYIIK